MKFQDTSIQCLKVSISSESGKIDKFSKFRNFKTLASTDTRTHGQAQSNMPYQLFQSWGHKNLSYNVMP